MKLTPVASPHAIQPTQTESDSARTARLTEKYVAIMNKGQQDPPQAQETLVANPNRVSAEELSAIVPTQAKESPKDATTEVTETKEAPKDPEIERRFAQIARQERQLRAKIHQENQRLKAREEAIAAREEAASRQTAPDLSQYIPKDRIKADPLTALEEAQADWDYLTQQQLQRQPTYPMVMSTIQKLQAEIADLRKVNETSQKTYQDQQAAQYQAALKQIRNDVKQLVYTDPEFETVKAMNATKDVVELIEKTYAKDGVVLSVEEATKAVEDYLVEEAMKVTQIEKIKKRMAAAKASQTSSDEKTPPAKQTQPMKTLTNATSSARKMSAKERAIARANGFTGDF
jgi:hypothetical protein